MASGAHSTYYLLVHGRYRLIALNSPWAGYHPFYSGFCWIYHVVTVRSLCRCWATVIGFDTIDHGSTVGSAAPSSSSVANVGLAARFPGCFRVFADWQALEHWQSCYAEMSYFYSYGVRHLSDSTSHRGYLTELSDLGWAHLAWLASGDGRWCWSLEECCHDLKTSCQPSSYLSVGGQSPDCPISAPGSYRFVIWNAEPELGSPS